MKKLLLLLLSFLLITSSLCAGGNRWTSKPPVGSTIDWGHPLSKGLVGCWLMNEGGGNQGSNLAIRNSKGTLSNGARFDQGGILLDATDDYIDSGSNSTYSIDRKGFTVLVSAKFASYTGDHHFAAKWDGTAQGGKWKFYYADWNGYVNFQDCISFILVGEYTNDSSVGAVATSTQYCTINTVYQLVAVYSGNTLDSTTAPYQSAIYVNGKYAATSQQNNGACFIGTSTVTLELGKQLGSTIYYTYIWKRTLSKSEIQQLYQDPYCFIKPPTIWSMFSTAVAAARRIWTFN